MSDETKDFKVVVRCGDCGEVLNESIPMTAKGIVDAWMQLVISSPLVTKPCPKGCRPTYSDCNANTDMDTVRISTGEKLEFEKLKAMA